MWDRPELLNGIARALFAAAYFLIAYAAVHYTMRLPAFPLREVRVGGELAHVTRDEIEAIVKRELQGNFFTLDLEHARAAFERLPWARRVGVRRQWPDRLDVALEEHVALARWGNAGLVNTYGEVFTGAAAEAAGGAEGARLGDGLPLFIGPPESAKEIAIQYGYFRRSLAAIGLAPAQVQVSPRRAWQVRLESGLTLELGRERIESRLDRFVAAYERTVNRLQRKVDYVDLRYSNGFAVRVPEMRHEPQDARRRMNGQRKR